MSLTPEEKKFIQAIGDKIVSLREEKGIKQKDLADLLDIEDSSLRRIESGRTNPTTSTLLRIANALDVSILDLLKVIPETPEK